MTWFVRWRIRSLNRAAKRAAMRATFAIDHFHYREAIRFMGRAKTYQARAEMLASTLERA